MIVHADTVEAASVRPGMRVSIGGDWRTASRVLVGAKRVTLWLDGKPWSMSARRFVRVWWRS